MMSKKFQVYQACLLIFVVFWAIILADAVDETVTITKFEVPPHVELNDDVALECDHNLPEGRLFHVEWHHNDKEFYRFSADSRDPLPKMQFNTSAGINVDLKGSSEKKVVILSIPLTATGLFECVVIGEEPFFNQDKRGANLTVVVIPTTKPKIEPPPGDSLRPGSQVNLNCTAAPSIPASELEWHVNDKPVPAKSLTKYEPEVLKKGLFVSKLGLHFKLERKHYKSGQLKLKCTAKIATFYTQEHNHRTILKDSNLRESPTRAAKAGCGCVRIQLEILVVMLVVWWR